MTEYKSNDVDEDELNTIYWDYGHGEAVIPELDGQAVALVSPVDDMELARINIDDWEEHREYEMVEVSQGAIADPVQIVEELLAHIRLSGMDADEEYALTQIEVVEAGEAGNCEED